MVLFLKLGFLAIRQASKPLANRARLFSESSDVFRAITLSVGRSLHRWTVYADRLALGKGSGFVTPLNEKLAISRGADFLSEGIVYSIASITVLYEYRHQQRLKLRSEQAAREAEERRIEAGGIQARGRVPRAALADHADGGAAVGHAAPAGGGAAARLVWRVTGAGRLPTYKLC